MPTSRTGIVQWALFAQGTRLKGRWRFLLSNSSGVQTLGKNCSFFIYVFFFPWAAIRTSLVTLRQLTVSRIRHIHADSGCHRRRELNKGTRAHLTQPETAPFRLCFSIVERAGFGGCARLARARWQRQLHLEEPSGANTFPLCHFFHSQYDGCCSEISLQNVFPKLWLRSQCCVLRTWQLWHSRPFSHFFFFFFFLPQQKAESD